jgi:glycerol-3-phosphate dehydrogenase
MARKHHRRHNRYPARVSRNPVASEEDIRCVLVEVRSYLSPDIKVRRGDVLSAWNGLRPLVRDPSAEKTEGLVWNHMINVSKSGLLTIAGGKWMKYRAMAQIGGRGAVDGEGCR